MKAIKPTIATLLFAMTILSFCAEQTTDYAINESNYYFLQTLPMESEEEWFEGELEDEIEIQQIALDHQLLAANQ